VPIYGKASFTTSGGEESSGREKKEMCGICEGHEFESDGERTLASSKDEEMVNKNIPGL